MRCIFHSLSGKNTSINRFANKSMDDYTNICLNIFLSKWHTNWILFTYACMCFDPNRMHISHKHIRAFLWGNTVHFDTFKYCAEKLIISQLYTVVCSCRSVSVYSRHQLVGLCHSWWSFIILLYRISAIMPTTGLSVSEMLIKLGYILSSI